MSSVQKIFIASMALLFLCACGFKGDLYLPEAQPQVVDTPVEDAQLSEEISNPERPETTPETLKEESPTP